MDEPRSPAATAASDPAPDRRLAHWRATRSMTVLLLLLWLFTGFSSIFFARQLAGLTVFGWPLSFYMAAQGSSLVSLALIGFYAWRMRRLDRAYHQRNAS